MALSAHDAFRRARLKTTPRESQRRLLGRRWLVLAPHPDDETLGTGALLCALADAGRPAQVAYLTDGAASHPASAAWPRGRLAAVRRREARAALSRLGGMHAPAPLFLDWPDGAPLKTASAGFERSAARLGALARSARVDAIAATWPHEPHCDHAAAAALAAAVAGASRGRIQLYWYLVWGWGEAESDQLAGKGAPAPPTSAAHAGRRRSALAAHRSQLGAVVDGGEGFRLPPAMVRNASGGQLLFGPVTP